MSPVLETLPGGLADRPTTPPPEGSPEWVRDAVDYWQRLLRLQDWDLDVSVQRAWDLKENTSGTCYVFPAKRHATIKLLDLVDRQDDWRPGYDMEQTLVHELLHIHLWYSNPSDDDWSTATGIAQEQAIHVLSSALLEQRRMIARVR